MHIPLSRSLFEEAKHIIPGGVNSPARSFNGVGGCPLFFNHAAGAYLYDEDNHQYLDYVGSWGPMILGHQHPAIIEAVQQVVKTGLSYGAPTRVEIALAQKVCEIIPSIDMIRMVNSGTEATMTAIRLARGFTGRDLLVKFTGCYHGHSDSLLIDAGSGLLTHGQTSSAGVPASIAEHTIAIPYNNIAILENLFAQSGDNIAAVIVEPVAGNMGCVPPLPEFLSTLRALCTQHKSVLIFDEVMTGFRVSLSGAQGYYGIKPDLTTLGKVIGGGMPVGAIGGRRDIMSYLAPLGPVYQAGTLSGNPVAMTAGLATLKLLTNTPDFYSHLAEKTRYLAKGLKSAAEAHQIPLVVNHVPGMLSVFFTDKPIENLHDVKKSDTEFFKLFFHGMLEEGIYLPPSAFETWFISGEHQQAEIEQTCHAAEKVFSQVKSMR